MYNLSLEIKANSTYVTRMSPAPVSLSLTSLLTSIESSIARPDGRGVTIGLMSVSSPSDSMLALTGGTTTGAVQCQNVSLISQLANRKRKQKFFIPGSGSACSGSFVSSDWISVCFKWLYTVLSVFF